MSDRTTPWDELQEINFYSSDFIPSRKNDANKRILSSPKNIYNYLSERCFGQENFKKILSVYIFKAMKGINSEKCIMLASPSGSGKSFLASLIAELLPSKTTVADCSSMVASGYKSGTHITTPLSKLDTDGDDPCFVFYDEFDKVLQKGNGSWSDTSLLLEFLVLFDDKATKINAGTDDKPILINPQRLFFILMGSFSGITEKERKSKHIGFNANIDTDKAGFCPYVTKEQILDLLNPELQGRISKICINPPMSELDFMKVLKSPKYSPASKLEKELGISIKIAPKKMRQYAHDSFESGTGVRGVKNAILEEVDEALFNDPNVKEIYIR